MIDTITAVLEHANEPMRARDIQAAGQEFLHQPLNLSSVKASLAEHARSPTPKFERVSRGRYRLG